MSTHETHGKCVDCGLKRKTTYLRNDGKCHCDKCFGKGNKPSCLSRRKDEWEANDDRADDGVSLHSLRAIPFLFSGGTSVRHAVEMMTNGSCGD